MQLLDHLVRVPDQHGYPRGIRGSK
jgi:hypothetical protein